MSVAALALPTGDQTIARRERVFAAAVEIALVAGFYQWYSVLRFWVGGVTGTAQRNALHVVGWERALGIFNESAVQAAVLGHPVLLRAAATYYGTMHFIVPGVALVLLYRRTPERYVTWRNALAWTSVLAVVAFALFPTMPPRLLPATFHFSNVTAPGVDRPFVPALYNGFAAMPSLHAAFSAWSALALWPVVRTRWARSLLVADFVVTVGVVVVTANHFYLDVVGGLAVVALGVLIARRRTHQGPTSAWAAAALLIGAAVAIWLPRTATLPLTLDVAAVAALGVLAIRGSGELRQPARPADTYV